MAKQSVVLDHDVTTLDDLIQLVSRCKSAFPADPSTVLVTNVNITFRGSRIQGLKLTYDPDQDVHRSVSWTDTPTDVLHSRD